MENMWFVIFLLIVSGLFLIGDIIEYVKEDKNERMECIFPTARFRTNCSNQGKSGKNR